MANFEIDEEVLVAFLKGELDAAEAEAVEAWYDRSAANRRMLGQVYYILYVSDRINDAAGIDVERSLRQFKRRMHAGRRISLRRSAVRIAAAAVVAAVLLAGGLTTVLLSKRLAQPVTVVTQLGERSQVVLPDGTKVWLNSSSSVEYVAPFFSRQRRVKMEGEAYFEVEHDRRAPFVVSTNGLDVEVLGTRFNIRNDDNDHRVTTVLLEGAVKASASSRTVVTRWSPPSCSKVPSRPLLRDTGRPRYACTPRSNWSSTPGRTPCA
jgi:transmembrane sensor